MILSASALRYRTEGSTLIDGVDVEMGPGDLVAVVGPNGAGKSTLLRLLAGALRPTAGEIALDDAPVGSLSAERLARLRAILGQQQAADVAFTVEEVVEMGRYPYRNDPSNGPEADRRAVRSALAALDLGGLEQRTVASLSGGERQRVAIARAIAQDTPFLLLDEPTTALDIRHQELVLRILTTLASEGRTVGAVLHDLTLATRFDRVLLLREGSIAAAGSPLDVLTSERLTDVYEHPVTVVDHPLGFGRLVLPIPMP